MDTYPLKEINSKYILKIIANNIYKKRLFQILNYNKLLQDKLEINLIDYKNYYYEKIEIELIPINISEKNYFIKFDEKDESYFHIFFNDDKKEINQIYFTNDDNVKKIKIIIDKEIKSFSFLFLYCKGIKKIKFIKFKRNDIEKMSGMFYRCSSLIEIDFNNNFNTINVTDMSYMFNGCSSLKELELNIFNTINVTDMSYMFNECSSLE